MASSIALFTIVNGVLLRPLPYKDSDRLVTVLEPVLGADFRDIQAQNHVFERAALFETGGYILSRRGRVSAVYSGSASPEFFSILGVAPVLGRGFTPDEYRPGSANVVLLSYALWVRAFSADRHVIGRAVRLNSRLYTIVGVLPRTFEFKRRWFDHRLELWLPLRLTPSQLEERGAPKWAASGPAPDSYSTWMLARLKRGVTVEKAQRNLDEIISTLVSEYPGDKVLLEYRQIYSLKYLRTGPIGGVLWPLLAGACLLLLISCVNVSGLMLSRGLGRRREMAIRAVLGARRRQIAGCFLRECLGVSVVAAALAVPASIVILDIFKTLAPAGYVPRLGRVTIDARVFAFVLMIVLLSAVLCGLIPAVVCSRCDPNSDLKGSTDPRFALRGSSRLSAQRFLLGMQIGSALVLLTGAGLMGRALWFTIHQKLGFDSRDTFLVSLTPVGNLQSARSRDFAHARMLSKELVHGLRTIPVVRSAAVGDATFDGFAQMPFAAGQYEGRVEDMPVAYWWDVSPEFFKTMGIPLLRGRDFTDADNEKSPPVVIINETLARLYFGGNGVGKHLTHLDPVLWSKKRVGAEIVGVVGDTRMAGLREPRGPEIYICLWQNMGSGWFVVNSSATSASLAAAIREKIEKEGQGPALVSVKPVAQAISESYLARPRFLMFLLDAFAAMALLLTVAGIFGATALSVTRRTHEIGIRVALGAQKKDVLKTVLFDSVIVAFSGVVVGTLAALALTRLIGSWLYGIPPDDPVTFVCAGVLLLTVCLVASYIPSRRALRVDPAVVLRAE